MVDDPELAVSSSKRIPLLNQTGLQVASRDERSSVDDAALPAPIPAATPGTIPLLDHHLNSEALSVASLGGPHRHRKVHSKLEVLRARQVDRITWMNLAVLLLGLAWSVSYLIWAWTAAFEPLNATTTDGRKVKIASYRYSVLMSLIDGGAAMLQVLVAMVITPIYFLRVFRNNKREVTSDQAMVGCQLVMNLISNNPVYIAYLLHDYVLYPNNPEKKWKGMFWVKPVEDFTYAAVYACWTCGIMLYVCIRLRMFSILEKLTRWQLFKRVVLPKILLASVYWTLLFTTGIIYKSFWGVLPFTSLICVLVNRRVTDGEHFPSVFVIYACCITALELVMIFGIVFTAVQTNRVLRPLNYFLYRSRIVSFRFFVVHNFGYILGFIVFDNLIAIAIPPGTRLKTSFLDPQNFALHNSECVASIFLMKIAWIIVTAYVSLPPDSVGLRGWFKSCEAGEIEEVYRIDEVVPVSLSLNPSPVTNPSIFGFQDAALMLNLSWLAYKQNREELDFYSGQLATPDKFEVISEEKYQTKVILVSLPDRIAVTFRGTTSTANIMTDLQVALDLVSDFLPSRPVGTQPKNSMKGWKRAKVHHGFAIAYQALAEKLLRRIQHLLSEDRRPVYLTGHSLGGALATVCSMDLILCGIGLTADQVTVMTFGSPRCGNKNWSVVYNKVVPSNWNVRIESDIVTMFPRFPYVHVGKTALLTVGGNLLLDPNALESKWSSELPSINFHKKQAYKMAFSVVCEKHLQGMGSGIWEFPVTEWEVRLWEKQCRVTFNDSQFSSLVSSAFDERSAKGSFSSRMSSLPKG